MKHQFHKPTDISIPKTSLWSKMPYIALAIGVVGLGITFAMFFQGEKTRAMFAYLWGYEYARSLALGGLAFTLIQHVVRAGWSTVVRRVAETSMATLPVFALLFVPIVALGMHVLFPWTHETDVVLERKRWFLDEGMFLVRAAAYFVIWTALAFLLYTRSTKQDVTVDGSPEREALTKSMWGIATAGLFLFVLTLTLQAVDWLKSLTPHWYSTMWGVYYFAGAMIAFYAFTILVTMALQNAGVLKTAVTTEHFHDLGKFMFGHTVFWGYIAFSQFMLQWYANMPEETEWWMARVEGGWANVSYALPVIHFFVPFLYLLSRHVKRSRMALACGAVYILIVHAIDLYWIVMPNAVEHGAEPHFAPSFIDVTAMLGVMGVFFAAYSFMLNRNKVVCIGDPRLAESMAHENY